MRTPGRQTLGGTLLIAVIAVLAACGGPSIEEQAEAELPPTIAATIVDAAAADSETKEFLADFAALRGAIDRAGGTGMNRVYVTIERALEMNPDTGAGLLETKLPPFVEQALVENQRAIEALQRVAPATSYGEDLLAAQLQTLKANVTSLTDLSNQLSSSKDIWQVIVDWGKTNNASADRAAGTVLAWIDRLPPDLREVLLEATDLAGLGAGDPLASNP